jgi:dienelactone hydrolase
MKVIVAADIHGVTWQLRAMIRPLAEAAIFLSPWDGDACPFPNEQDAHAAFIAGTGLESYAKKIAAAAGNDPAFIVGFSVGASAAWLHAASGDGHAASVATLYYGSRIRDHSSRVPRFRITAIFAEAEPSFVPAQLARIIASDRVHVAIEPGTAHGFMNPCSANFEADRCTAHLQELAAGLARFHLSIIV